MSKGVVICVDDDTSILKSLESELISVLNNNYELEFAQSAIEALELIEEFIEQKVNIPLIISDCIMPIMMGDEFLIKVHNILKDTKTIMLTGQADVENIKNAINKANLYRYLAKPWDRKDLLLTITEAIKSYEDNLEIKRYQQSLEEKIKDRTKELQSYMEIVDKNVITSITDVNGVITYASKAFSEISGYSKDELIGKKHNIVRHPQMSNLLFKDLWQTITSGKVWSGEVKNLSKDGREYWVKNTITPMFKGDKIVGFSSIRQDITDKKEIERLAIIDDLTSLYNRRFFNETFLNQIDFCKKNNLTFSFMIFDIDYFKKYNDFYGHQKGDDVLKEVSKSLKKTITRLSRTDFLYRLGGEEFGVICVDESFEKILYISQTIIDTVFNLKIEHKKSLCADYLSVSIGVYFANSDKINSEDNIYRLADEALYRAKNFGRNRIEIYKEE